MADKYGLFILEDAAHALEAKSNNRKDVKKVVHSDAPSAEAPDPRWAGELSKLKELLANQKTAV